MTKDEQWLLEEKYGGKESAAYKADKGRLARGEPLAYVIGSQPFLGLKIFLDSHPLIPRPETEWWTEQLLNTLASQKPEESFSVARLSRAARSAAENGSADERPIRFLDLCAGSGAIGCAALAKLPNVHVSFGEIDPAHEATIWKNIRENNLDDARADVRIGDLFEPFGTMTFDVIAANPPYVPAGRTLPRSVADYEPPRAFLAGEDGLNVLRRIARELPNYLAKSGVAWVECDRENTEATRALFSEQGLNALIRTDQYGKPRIIVAAFPNI
ncbi:MAG TPA: HemK/PrmC family methyltransferase [Candidatus Paceibacterota bacterium]|nr:HemK/PrmC family methyltransferase [Candidatus Paceibacterota bacterium]